MMADERKHAACVECREKKLRCAPSLEPGSACSRYGLSGLPSPLFQARWVMLTGRP